MPAKEKKRIRPVIEEVSSEQDTQVPQKHEQPVEAVVEPKEEKSPEEKAREIISDSPPVNSPPSGKTNYKLILLVTVISALVVGFVAGGVYVYFSGLSQIEETAPQPTQAPEAASPTPTSQASPSPIPGEEIDVTSYKVSVLNGSGQIGAAGSAGSLLEDQGFEVANIGNANRYDYEATVVQVKETVPEQVIQMVEDALSDTYSVELGDELPSTSGYDIIVTVGTE